MKLDGQAVRDPRVSLPESTCADRTERLVLKDEGDPGRRSKIGREWCDAEAEAEASLPAERDRLTRAMSDGRGSSRRGARHSKRTGPEDRGTVELKLSRLRELLEADLREECVRGERHRQHERDTVEPSTH